MLLIGAPSQTVMSWQHHLLGNLHPRLPYLTIPSGEVSSVSERLHMQTLLMRIYGPSMLPGICGGTPIACEWAVSTLSCSCAGRTWQAWTGGLPPWTLLPCVPAANGHSPPHLLANPFHTYAVASLKAEIR